MNRTYSVVIATLGRPELLRRAIASVQRCEPGPHEIVVVDGDGAGSAGTAAREAGALGPVPVRYVLSPRGSAHQRNVGTREATGDIVLYLDDDAQAPADGFALLDRLFDEPEVVGATGYVSEPGDHRVGGRRSFARDLLPGGGREGTFTRYGFPRRLAHVDIPRDVEFMQGCFMAARRQAALAVGFDEQLRDYALAEDEDFSFRLSRLGRIRYEPAIVVEHDNAGYLGRDRRAFGRKVVLNRAYLFRKNFPQTRRARLEFALFVLLLLGHRLLNGDWWGALGTVEGALRMPSARPA